MLTLAIDLSSNVGSTALVNETGELASRSWGDCVHERQTLFNSIKDIMDETRTTWDDIDFYSVGRGPGSFSGLRVAFTVAKSLAMPDNKPVIAVSSGEAIAREAIITDLDSQTIAVIGDARRQLCWLGQFKRVGHTVEKTMDYELIPYDEVGAHISDGTRVITPDWERLDEKLQTQCPNATLTETNVQPHATFIGIIALEHMTRDGVGEEQEPLYMHPPVFIAPKYV